MVEAQDGEVEGGQVAQFSPYKPVSEKTRDFLSPINLDHLRQQEQATNQRNDCLVIQLQKVHVVLKYYRYHHHPIKHFLIPPVSR